MLVQKLGIWLNATVFCIAMANWLILEHTGNISKKCKAIKQLVLNILRCWIYFPVTLPIDIVFWSELRKKIGIGLFFTFWSTSYNISAFYYYYNLNYSTLKVTHKYIFIYFFFFYFFYDTRNC